MTEPPSPVRETFRQKAALDRLWLEADMRDRRRSRLLASPWLPLVPMLAWFGLLPFVSFGQALVAGVIAVALIAFLGSSALRDFFSARRDAASGTSRHR